MQENLEKIISILNSSEHYEETRIKEYFTKLFKILYPKISDICNFYYRNGAFFYRGMNKFDDVFIYSPRKDRKPMDTDLKTHEFFNEIFDNLTDGKINRSNATFAVADYSIAEDYGRPFIIFPFNGFDYLFSTKISDLYEFQKKQKEKIYFKRIYKGKYVISFIIDYDNLIIRLMKNNTDIENFYEELKNFYKSKYKSKKDKLDLKDDPYLSLDEKHGKILDMIRNIDSKKHKDFLIKILEKYTMRLTEFPKYREDFTNTVEKYYNFNKNLEIALLNKKNVEVMFRADNVLCIYHFLLSKNMFYEIMDEIKFSRR